MASWWEESVNLCNYRKRNIPIPFALELLVNLDNYNQLTIKSKSYNLLKMNKILYSSFQMHYFN